MRVIEGVVTSPFGIRKHPVTGATAFHNGIDVAAPVGTHVMCPVNGVVSEIYTTPKGGLTLIVTDGSVLRFGFCHLSEILVKVGDRVTKKQSLAKSGNSGVGTGPHLHFTVKVGVNYVNPVKYLEIE